MGLVEVKEVYVDLGDRAVGRKRLKGKGETTQLIAAVAAEVLEPKGIGRICLRRIESVSQEHVQPFAEESIEPPRRRCIPTAHGRTDSFRGRGTCSSAPPYTSAERGSPAFRSSPESPPGPAEGGKSDR